jgi:hypothetical protein
MACSAVIVAEGTPSPRRREACAIDALLIDETIVMPRPLTAYAQRGARSLPVIGIQLDAAGYAAMIRVLDRSQALAGISSGATLFCVERIAWDRGFRLAGRSERHAGEAGAHALRQDVATYLKGEMPPTASTLRGARSYRPSRTDATLHAWVLRRPARSRSHTDRREV